MAIRSQVSTVLASGSASHSAAGNWVVFNQYPTPFNVGFSVHFSALNTTGAGPSMNFGVQHTFDNIQANKNTVYTYVSGGGTVSGDPQDIIVHDHSEVSGVSANLVGTVDGNYAFPIAAARVVINSVVSATILSQVSGFARFIQSGF